MPLFKLLYIARSSPTANLFKFSGNVLPLIRSVGDVVTLSRDDIDGQFSRYNTEIAQLIRFDPKVATRREMLAQQLQNSPMSIVGSDSGLLPNLLKDRLFLT